MACLVSLLTDAEAEVRAAAVAHLATMTAWGGAAHFSAHLQPLLPALADDVVMEVRSKCALALMDCAHGGVLEDSLVLSSIGPLLESFLQDEFQEVQLQVLQNLDKISHLLPALSQVVQCLLQMSVASNWRVRQAVGILLPHLAEARGLDFFSSVLMEPSWMTLLLDPVSCVRQSLVQGVELLCKVAGADWINQTLLPAHEKLYNTHGYLIRVTILQAHAQVALALKKPEEAAPAIDFIVKSLSDKVPNVRMVAAQGLGKLESLEEKTRSGMEACLKDEKDDDVRYALERALADTTS